MKISIKNRYGLEVIHNVPIPNPDPRYPKPYLLKIEQENSIDEFHLTQWEFYYLQSLLNAFAKLEFPKS